MQDTSIENLRTLCLADNIKWTTHILTRMRERNISSEDITNAVISGEIIKHYQDDKPYPSCLIYNGIEDAPLHVVVSTDDSSIYMITVYSPTLDEWENDFKTRKETE